MARTVPGRARPDPSTTQHGGDWHGGVARSKQGAANASVTDVGRGSSRANRACIVAGPGRHSPCAQRIVHGLASEPTNRNITRLSG